MPRTLSAVSSRTHSSPVSSSRRARAASVGREGADHGGDREVQPRPEGGAGGDGKRLAAQARRSTSRAAPPTGRAGPAPGPRGKYCGGSGGRRRRSGAGRGRGRARRSRRTLGPFSLCRGSTALGSRPLSGSAKTTSHARVAARGPHAQDLRRGRIAAILAKGARWRKGEHGTRRWEG